MYNIHNYLATIKVQETLFPGEDYKGEEPLFTSSFFKRAIDIWGFAPYPTRSHGLLDLLLAK
jgi:hypothetical protein